jgi:hypothetical protein
MFLFLLLNLALAQLANITLHGPRIHQINTRLVARGPEIRIVVKHLLPLTNYTLYIANTITNGNCDVTTGGFTRDQTSLRGIGHFGFKLLDKKLNDLVGLGIVIKSFGDVVCGNVEMVYYSGADVLESKALPTATRVGSKTASVSVSVIATATAAATADSVATNAKSTTTNEEIVQTTAAAATNTTTTTTTMPEINDKNPNLVPGLGLLNDNTVPGPKTTSQPNSSAKNPNLMPADEPSPSSAAATPNTADASDPGNGEINSGYTLGVDAVWVLGLVYTFF